MLYRPSKKLTCVIYEDQKSPRCYEFKASRLKLYTFLVPILSIAAAGVIFGGQLLYQKKLKSVEVKESSLVQELKQEKLKLSVELEGLKKINSSLTEKISSKSSDTAPLHLFAPILGHQDIQSDGQVDIEIKEPPELRLSRSNPKKFVMDFKLINKRQDETKLAGYIFVVFKSGSTFQVFPRSAIEFSDHVTKFSLGDYFAVSRFKDVSASFFIPQLIDEDMFFKVIIFSRLGDLLLEKDLGPLKYRIEG